MDRAGHCRVPAVGISKRGRRCSCCRSQLLLIVVVCCLLRQLNLLSRDMAGSQNCRQTQNDEKGFFNVGRHLLSVPKIYSTKAIFIGERLSSICSLLSHCVSLGHTTPCSASRPAVYKRHGWLCFTPRGTGVHPTGKGGS